MGEKTENQPEAISTPKLESATGRALMRFVLRSFLEIVDGKIQPRRNQEERDVMFKLFKLGELYFSEMCQCIDGNARLSATVMACSGFEVILMLACIGYRDIVRTTKTWRFLSRKAKTHSFIHILQSRQMTIQKLIEIGEELSWFSADVPEELVANLDPNEMTQLLALVPVGTTAASIAPRYAKDYRNRLHPAVCLRNDVTMEDPQELFGGVAFVLVALSCFAMQHGAES